MEQYIVFFLAIGLMVGVSGCSSLGYDDQELIHTWDQYIEKRAEFTSRFNSAMQEENTPAVLAAIKEFGRYTTDTYYEVVEYQVSPDMEKSHYWFAYHLKTQVDCCNQMGTYLKKSSEGDESFLEYERYYREFMEIPCDAADSHLKKAYENLPKR